MTTRDERVVMPSPPTSDTTSGADGDRAPAASPIAGLAVGAAATVRSGEDTRRRGWFWHWNSIVTQYAPLIGLKGVGLLNSYTVWTDRREESPHRGYAFPSQQSEADFYGEDRAELMTINKILVALDLIEIRKEMVLRTDSQGRRWRVPHNFYRVKDHDDSFSLSERDVLRVAALADRDKAVYRYVRRVFSPRFAPIDGDNVWHRILPQVRQTDLWQRLAERAAHEEDRASARTRAGHAARRTGGLVTTTDDFLAPTPGDATTTIAPANDSTSDETVGEDPIIVGESNNGSGVDVARSNNGSMRQWSTMVEESNAARQTGVDPTNTTYYQSDITTTTNGGTRENESARTELDASSGAMGAPTPDEFRQEPSAAIDHEAIASAPVQAIAAIPNMLEMTTPFDGPGEATAFRAFEEANVRPVTPAERRLLRDLANRFEATAVAAARHDSTIPGSGWGWLAAAIYEAVAAGSAFVAPRRLREILSRWERDGFPQLDDGRARTAAGTGGMRGEHEVNPPRESLGNSRPGVNARSSAGGQIPDPPGEAPNLMLPHGHGSRETWAFTVGLLETALERAVLTELVAGTAITGYREGEVTIRVPDRVRAERFATVYRELVTRKLSEAMRRPVRLAVLTPMTEAEDGAIAPTLVIQDGRSNSESATMTAEAEAESIAPSFVVAECGLPSGQVWAAVLGEVMTNGMVSRTNYDAWLRVTRLIGRGGAGEAGTSLVVGVANGLAERRVSGRFMPALRAAVFAVVGARLEIEVVVTDEWLAARTPGEALPLLAMRRATGG